MSPAFRSLRSLLRDLNRSSLLFRGSPRRRRGRRIRPASVPSGSSNSLSTIPEHLEDRTLLAGVAEIEPNNVLGAATQLTLANDPLGSGMFTAYGEGLQDPASAGDTWSDPDYWSFTALAGDVVSISVATPTSDVDSYAELRNSADGTLTSDNNSGADTDAFISHYTIATSGDYFVRIGKNSSSTVSGAYQLRVDVARGINLESDAQYANDSIAGADSIAFPPGAPQHAVAQVSGTVMEAEGANTDEDYFSLGILDPGNTVTLTT
jgi:large repetitive protein